MEMMKRVLALLLVFAMLMPNLTTIASAADTGEEPVAVSTEPVAAAEGSGETEASTEPAAEETEPPVQETEASEQETEPFPEETEAPAEQMKDAVAGDSITVQETVTSPAANEHAATVSVEQTLTVEDTVAPVSDYSAEDMLGMYLDRVLYPDRPSMLGTGGYDNLDSDAIRNLYTDLKAKLKAVADQGGNTVFTFNTADLATLGFLSTMTAEDMDLDPSNFTNQELLDKVDRCLALDLSAVINALLADCPYELYWYDKVTGSNLEYEIYTWADTDTGEFAYVTVDNLSISFAVADNYVGEGDYDVTPAVATAAAQTVKKAGEVRDSYKDLDDIAKLHAYKQWIMEEVSYDHDAADEGDFSVNNDPWQIIYAFDEDPETNIVCEGYSKAFQYLCDLSDFEADVESFLVTGYAGGPHMWNIVSINGRNYMVDVTNTDPDDEGAFGQDGSLFLAGTSGSIQDGYAFENSNGGELSYTYYYEATVNGTKKTIHPSVDDYGDDEDSILNLSFLGYEAYQALSAAQKEMLDNGDLEDGLWIVDSVELRDLGDISGVNLTVSGATLKLSGYTSLRDCSVDLENGARLVVQGDLYLSGSSHLNFGDGTYLQIEGDTDNRKGTIYVQESSGIFQEDNVHILVPEGAVYADFYAAGDQVPDMDPEKLTVRCMVSDQEELLSALESMSLEGNEEPAYHGYEITARKSFTIQEEWVTIPAHIAFSLHNGGDRNDPVVITIAKGSTLEISGCYMGIYEGTQLRVEGTMVDDGYLRTHQDSAVNVIDNGILKVLGHLDNQGIVYVATEEQLLREEGSTWENNEPMFATEEYDSYLSLRFLEYDNGWHENFDSDLYGAVTVSPGQQFNLIAYLNVWDAQNARWEASPVHASKLVVDGNLILEPFAQLDDPVWDNENMDAFFRLRAADGSMDQENRIAYSNTEIKADVTIGRLAGGFYSADPSAAGADRNALWINEFQVGSAADSFYFYYDASKYYEEGWTLTNVKAATDRDQAAVTLNNVGTNLWKITPTSQTLDNIYAIRDFWVHVEYTLARDGETRKEDCEVRCYAADFGDPRASFSIDGVRYHASYNYDGLFAYVGEPGEEYPVPAQIEGVSYDIQSNTLTLNGAKLESLYIDHHWYDEQRDEEGWNLPDSRFNIELVGSNSISAVNDHALRISNEVYLTIRGNGSLDISMVGDENNDAFCAVHANNSNMTIEGDAKVTVSVSGIGCQWDNGEYANMAPIVGHGEESWLRLRENAVLTTVVPAGSCTNGHFDAEGNFVEGGGFTGIDFVFIEVNDNATLNTQTIRVWDEGRGNAYGAYYQNGGTVNITALPHYNKDYVSEETNEKGHYHFSGLEADYGKIEVNGGTLNLNMTATDAQKTRSVYFYGIHSRGRHIALNGGVVNVNSNFSGTGIQVGQSDWDGGTNAWMDFNNGTLNMTGSNLYRCAIRVDSNGSVNFNGGVINAHRADIDVQGNVQWNNTEAHLTECGVNIRGTVTMQGGYLHVKNGQICVRENGNLLKKDGYVELDNSFVLVDGKIRMEQGAFTQSLDYRKLTTDGSSAKAFVIGESGRVEVCGDAYLEITGIDKVDGICNYGVFHQQGGCVVVDVDETAAYATAFTGFGAARFEKGAAYLDGDIALLQFYRGEDSTLYVGGSAMMEATGRKTGIITYAPAEFAGGSVNAYAQKADNPIAVVVENNDGGTNASLTIRGGSHYFAVFDGETLAENGVGFRVVDAPVTLTGGELDVEAAVAVVVAGDATVAVPEFISNETGGSMELTEDAALNGKTLLVGENYARSVAFRTSRNCGENVTWNLENGVLTISGTGKMDDYHMPARDPDSWRTAPWYAMRDVITKVVVEEGIEYVGDWAFGRLPEVTEIVYSSTVNRIDMTSNYDCPKLEKFTVAEGNAVYSVSDEGRVLIENGSLVRAAVKGIISYKAGDGITTIGMGAFDSSALETLDLNKVQVIQNYAFADCYNLKEVVIPEGVATIEMTVFQNSGLESVTIPASVTKIRNYAFDGCTALADVYYTGNESQWNTIIIGSGNNALTSIPVTFLEESQEQAGDPYLSYRLLAFGEQGYFEDTDAEWTEMTIPVGYYPALVVYCNYWNPEAQTWERFAVDPEQLYAASEDGTVVDDLQIGLFRNYEGIGIEEGEPNAYHFLEMAFQSGWGSDRYLCLDVGEGKVAKLPVHLARGHVGFYSADPTSMSQEERNAAWLNLYRINPNVSGGHSVYFALTEYNGDFNSAPVIASDKLSAEDLAKVTVEEINGSVYKITLPDDVAAKVYDYRGIPLQVTYQYGEVAETVDFTFGSVSFAGQFYSFVINGVWYEYYPGLEGYFSWDDENQKRLCYQELPGGMTYDEASDTLTMKDSTIESLQVYWNWHNEETGESGYATKDSDLTLQLIGDNKIVNPNSNAALAVGDGLTLTITGDENSSLLIRASNENATADNYAQNAVNIYNDADLVIAGDTSVVTEIDHGGKQLNDAWLMNIWAGGNNTITVKDNASLSTTLPDGARDDGDAYVRGYEGIGWFGQLRVQDNATLNTSTLGLGEYYDEHNSYRGKGSFVQTGGTTNIVARGFTNDDGSHGYQGLVINGGTEARISGGKLTVRASASYTIVDEQADTYDGFNGIQVNGYLEIENAEVEIQIPYEGAGLELTHAAARLKEGATLKIVGNGCDNYALMVNEGGDFQLEGGMVDVTDAKVRVQGGKLEIHNGMLSVLAEEYPHQTGLEIWKDSKFYLHNGTVLVDNGMTEDTPDAVSVGGYMELNGGTMTVSGTNGMGVHDQAELHQNGTELLVNGVETTLTVGNQGKIHLNGGVTNAVLGKKVDGGEIDMGGMMPFALRTADAPGTVINSWSSAVNVYDGGYLEVNDGHHTFRVDGTPGTEIENLWLGALDANGDVVFNGGTVILDAGPGGNAIFNRSAGDNSTIHFNHDLGAVSAEDGTRLDMHHRGENSEAGEYYFSLGTEDESVSAAKIMRTSAGTNSAWRIERDGYEVALIISGSQNMYNYYMPQNEAEENWEKTPWFDYNDQITYVVVEDGINQIGDWVFARMTNLKYVALPGSVNHISTSAFYGCPNLESFEMPGNDNYRLAEDTDNVIIEGGWKILLAAPSVTEFTVPGNISEIGNGAFQNCTDLTSIEFETDENGRCNVSNIGNNAFANTGLTKIELPEGIKSIGRSAFENCKAATELALPASVNAIRPYAFSGCSNVETITYAGSEAEWSMISIGSGNNILDPEKITFQQTTEAGEDHLTFRWLNYGENGWEENEHAAQRDVYAPAGMTLYGVFYYNHWDETGSKWVITPVIPTAVSGSGITIRQIDDAMMKEFGWEIAQGETNGAYFVRLMIAEDAWDDGETNYGIVTHQSVRMDMHIERGQYGFYSSAAASNETWLNEYEMNPLRSNEFYFIFQASDGWTMDDNSFRIWNNQGIPASYIKKYDAGDGIFRIVLDPVFMQDAWKYGDGFQLWAGFDKIKDEERQYEETDLQIKPMDLGNPDAGFEINGLQYLYFAEHNGWMTIGDPANDWRPGVVNLPAGVSYDYSSNTLTLNNAKLNSLGLRYRKLDENGVPTDTLLLPGADLKLNLIGNSVITSDYCSALNINGNLNVTVNGAGSLKLYSHNDTENRDDRGQRYAFDTVVVEHGSTLTIAGGDITAEIDGEGYWNEGNPAMPAALRGREGSGLVVSGGSLTTVVPGNARDNGPEEVDFEEYYSTHAIAEFDSVTVSGGQLNTTSLYVNRDETFRQTGGVVNITGLGHISWQQNEYGNQYQNYHYNGLQIHDGAKAEISGGELNISVTPRDWEHGSNSYYSGLSIAGGTAEISDDAVIRVYGGYEGNAISVGHDYDDHGQPCANGALTMTGGTLEVSNVVSGSQMNGIEVNEGCTANISGGTLNLDPANSFAGIYNMGTLTIGKATVNLNQAVCSSGDLTIDGAMVNVSHAAGADMYAWDIVPGSRFDFKSGTINATNAAFMIGGEMWIQEQAALDLTDSDFHADGAIILNGGSLTMRQTDLVDNKFLGIASDEWGNTWEEYKHQSRLYVSGELNLNSGKLELTNVPMNVEGSAVVNQNGADVTILNETATPTVRNGNAYETDNWMVSARFDDRTTLNINGGSITMTNINFDNGLESNGTININNGQLTITMNNADANSALRSNGDLYIRGGALTVDTKGFAALASQGQTQISGGTVKLSGEVGFHLWYEEGFENGKLTVTGGTIDIDAVNTGIDLYNNMVVTGGQIDIAVSGADRQYTDDNGVPMKVLAGCGIMAYNEEKNISISINGGKLNIVAPETVADGYAISSYGILGSKNSTVRINGGDIRIKARAALYAEALDDASKHILVNNRLHVLSLMSGNTLDPVSGQVADNADGTIWYGNTYAENGIFRTPFNNFDMDGYATDLRIVSSTAGTNATWDLQDGILTIAASGDKVGTMEKIADWNQVADKIIRLIVDPSIMTVDTSALDLMGSLKSVKVPHGSAAEAYAKDKGIGIEYFHQPSGDRKCVVENCALSTFTSIVESELKPAEQVTKVQEIPNEDLKQELETDEESAAQFEELDAQIRQELEEKQELAIEIKPAEKTEETQKEIHEILDTPVDAEPSIVGAAMNAEETSKEVALIIGESSQTDEIDTTQYEKVVRFSMELTTTDKDADEATPVENLKTPVQITLPLPNGMDVDRLVILHYHDESGIPEEVKFTSVELNGQWFVSFWVTGFSDFDMRLKAQKLQVVVHNKTMTYNGTMPELTYEIQDESGKVIDELPAGVTVTVNSPTVTKAGTYSITATVRDPSITVVPGTLMVAKQQYTVTMDNQEMVIGAAELPAFTYQAAPELPAGLTIQGKVVGEITKAGEYVITAEPVESDFYAVTVIDGKLTVRGKPLTVTMDNKSMKVGENQPELTYTVQEGDRILTAEEVAAYGLKITPRIDLFKADVAGTYTITAFVEEHELYEVTVKAAELTVKAEEVIPEFAQKPMGGYLTLKNEVFLTVYYTFVNQDELDIETVKERAGLLVWSADEAPAEADAVYENCENPVSDTAYLSSLERFETKLPGIPAKEMGDALAFRPYYQLEDGSYVYGRYITSYSPKTYCYNKLKDTDTSDDALMVAILNYGAAAQNALDYRTNDLMNSNLTEAQKALNWDGSLVRSNWNVPAEKAGELTKNGNITTRGGYLTLKGAIDYAYYAMLDTSISIAKAEIYYWTESDYNAADVLTLENATTSERMTYVEYADGKKRYEAVYEGLPARHMFSPVYACAVFTDMDGNMYYGGAVAYCPERYGYMNQNSSDTNTAIMAKRMVIYGDAARSYFGQE